MNGVRSWPHILCMLGLHRWSRTSYVNWYLPSGRPAVERRCFCERGCGYVGPLFHGPSA